MRLYPPGQSHVEPTERCSHCYHGSYIRESELGKVSQKKSTKKSGDLPNLPLWRQCMLVDNGQHSNLQSWQITSFLLLEQDCWPCTVLRKKTIGHLCPLALILLPYENSSVIGAGGQNVSEPIMECLCWHLKVVFCSPGMSPSHLPDRPLVPNQACRQTLGSVFHIKNPHWPIAVGEKH